ncbi:MAG: inosine/xanthosine triphosphatase [Myxococcota bacterium]|nr:inosine/xanthosine triphosphatase [Myxococcota bacterium]
MGPRSGIRFACVRVGTRNGPKLEAVRGALAAFPMDPEPEVVGHAVESGVSEQPVGLKEIVAGARNRAWAAYEQGACDLAVGIEDGLVVLPELGSEVMNIGAAVLTDGARESTGLSSGFAYPPACLPPALERREPIGGVFDRYWKESEGEEFEVSSGLSVGNIGRLSRGALTRSEYGRHAVICALVRFLHPEMYPITPASDSEGMGEPAQGSDLEAPERKSG